MDLGPWRCRLAAGAALCAVLAPTIDAQAHWCNNIFSSPARLVVKPEQTTVNVGASGTQLRVYLRNNFPYRLFDTRMRGDAPGYSIPETAWQNVHPGQEAGFLLTITPSGGATGDVQVTTLNLQVAFRLDGFRDANDCFVDQNPSTSMLTARSEYGVNSPSCGASNQSASLSAATLADNSPSQTLGSGQPTFGRTGVEQLINFFGYRFCYSSSGGWRSGNDDCPEVAAEGNPWTSIQQFGQNCMRAGVELGVRKAQLGSKLADARDAAVNAMAAGSSEHMCVAAVVGGYLYQGAAATSFTTALSASPMPQACKNAGLRALDGSNASSNCSSANYYEEAACAAAEGLNGNYGPVTSVLMPNAGDGAHLGGYTGLYYSYMLYLVAGHSRATSGVVPFYPDAGGSAPSPDSTVDGPSPDSTVDTAPPADSTVDTAPSPDTTVDTTTPQPDTTVDTTAPQPDTTVDSASPPPDTTVDTGAPPPDTTVDTGAPPPDTTAPPPDTGTPPPDSAQGSDSDVTPPWADSGVTPPGDSGVTPGIDGGPQSDSATNPAAPGTGELKGGCAVGHEADAAPLPLLLAAALLLMRRRRDD